MNDMIFISVILTIASIFVTLCENFFEIIIDEIEEKENLKSKNKKNNASCLVKIIISIIFMIITIVTVIITQDDSNILHKGNSEKFTDFFRFIIAILFQGIVVGVMWKGDMFYVSDNLKLYYTHKKNNEGFIKAFIKSLFVICVSIGIPVATSFWVFFSVLNL